MFHIELRQAPHSLHRFNLTEQELQAAVLAPWVQGQRIEMGERSWSAEAGTILVLEGPEIPVGRLTMGRGWSIARREGRDVTEKVLASVREALVASAASAATEARAAQAGAAQAGAAPSGAVAPTDADVLADALGLELLRGLGKTPMSLISAWRIAAQRHPQMPLGVSLDLTRRAVASLARSQLVVLGHAGSEAVPGLREAELDAALSEIDSWTVDAGPGALWIRRA